MDLTLRSEAIRQERSKALADARGDVLEIGFGTALNLPHYPPGVTRLTALDAEDLLPARTGARLARAPFPVERVQLSAERLPFPDARFDCVVSTFTLCTIPDARAALRQIRRVLKPDGRFVFLEHGRSDDARTARRQDLLTPLQRRIAAGCNLNRSIDTLVREAGFEIDRLARYALPRMPRVFAEFYRGTALVPA